MSQLTPETKQVKLDQIRPYEKNPRINDHAVDPLVISIQQYGFLVPIVVDKDGVIITGHTRYQAAQKLQLEEVPVIYATHLDEAQVNAFRIADNRLAQNATWDEELLQEELINIQSMGFNLQFTGFSKEELDCLTEPVHADCLENLSYAQVCGDVEEEQAKQGMTVVISVGTYRCRVAAQDFVDWENTMLSEFDNKSAIQLEILRRLGISVDSEGKEEVESQDTQT